VTHCRHWQCHLVFRPYTKLTGEDTPLCTWLQCMSFCTSKQTGELVACFVLHDADGRLSRSVTIVQHLEVRARHGVSQKGAHLPQPQPPTPRRMGEGCSPPLPHPPWDVHSLILRDCSSAPRTPGFTRSAASCRARSRSAMSTRVPMASPPNKKLTENMPASWSGRLGPSGFLRHAVQGHTHMSRMAHGTHIRHTLLLYSTVVGMCQSGSSASM
jgi:hypothetical protein